MRPKSAAFLWDIQRSARLVIERTAGLSVSELEGDIILRSAIERHLEIIGEASRRLSEHDPETFDLVPHLLGMIRLRNVIAHQYERIDWSNVRNIIDGPLVEISEEVTRLLDVHCLPEGRTTQ